MKSLTVLFTCVMLFATSFQYCCGINGKCEDVDKEIDPSTKGCKGVL